MTHHTGSDEGLDAADQASVEWALAYARGYWRHGNEPETQAALTIFSRAILAARAAAPDALRERVEALAGRLEGFAATTIRADDAPLYAAIAAELRAALAERPADGAGT